jgi:tetratricopeptide (TPR) repeat protein
MASLIPTRWLLAVGLLLSFTASAQGQNSEAMKVALEGKRAFEAGEYEIAIRKYEAAQRIKPAPGLLFNLAQSHRFAGHSETAASYFRNYLLTRPDPAQARAIAMVVERLQAQRLVEIAAERLGIERARLSLVQRQVELGLCSELSPEPITKRWWFWTILGAVSVGIAVSFAVGLR